METFICDFIFHSEHRIEMTEVIAEGKWEALEWMEEAFMELHSDPNCTPDLLRLRRGEETLAIWETHFDVVT